MRSNGVRDLLVWQSGIALVEEVYHLTRAYPRDELFGLTSQTRRAAVSVPANIAEGYGRGTQASYGSFLRIARGSLRELETHLIVATRVGVVDGDQAERTLAHADELGRMLHVLIDRVRQAQEGR